MDTNDVIVNVAFNALQAELKRGDALHQKAEKLIVAVGVVSGFQLIDIKNVITLQADAYTTIFVVLSFLMLSASLLYAFLSMRVMQNKLYPKERKLLERLEESKEDANKLSFEISGLYLDIRSAKANINDKRAKLLTIGGYLLLAAFFMIVLINVAELALTTIGCRQ